MAGEKFSSLAPNSTPEWRETRTGIGKIFNDEMIDNVRYYLVALKEYVINDSFGGSQTEIEGMEEVNGTVTFFGRGIGFMPDADF